MGLPLNSFIGFFFFFSTAGQEDLENLEQELA